MSGHGENRRYEVVAETRRRWSKSEKLAIVAEASVPDVNVSAIARRHGMQPSLLFRWREQFADALEGDAESSGPGSDRGPSFVPVTLPAAIPQQSACTVEIGGAMIPVPAGVRVWLATGHTDMRKVLPGLALLVQEKLKADPHCGHSFAGAAAGSSR